MSFDKRVKSNILGSLTQTSTRKIGSPWNHRVKKYMVDMVESPMCDVVLIITISLGWLVDRFAQATWISDT